MKQRKRSQNKHVAGHVYTRKDGSKGIKLWTPEKVLPIHDAEELKLQLKHYSSLLIKHHTPDSPGARRKYVEKIRPALRFYCQKFGVKVPQWLADDSMYTERMSVQDRTQMFGTKRLNIREFKQVQPVQGGGPAEEGQPQ